jgi:hypothetical protein
MARSKRKRLKPRDVPAKPEALNPPLDPMRTGMPAQDSIISVEEFPKKAKPAYRLIHTNEVDEYEQQPKVVKKKKR